MREINVGVSTESYQTISETATSWAPDEANQPSSLASSSTSWASSRSSPSSSSSSSSSSFSVDQPSCSSNWLVSMACKKALAFSLMPGRLSLFVSVCYSRFLINVLHFSFQSIRLLTYVYTFDSRYFLRSTSSSSCLTFASAFPRRLSLLRSFYSITCKPFVYLSASF